LSALEIEHPGDARDLHDRRIRLVLFGFVIALVAANLRPALASVGPVLADVRTDLGLSGGTAALLAALPVLCLGGLAFVAPALARRLSIERVITFVLVVVFVGLLGRVLGGTGVLFAGTVVVSAAIATANVLIPALIKRDFPQRTGLMTGVYATSLSASAAIAAGATVPIGDLLRALPGTEWRAALGAWALPALIALLGWIPVTRARRRRAARQAPVETGNASEAARLTPRQLLRDRLAWQVTLFFGMQSLVFYAVLAWLPSIFRDSGYSPTRAGLLLSFSALVQVPTTLIVPHLAGRARDQRLFTTGATVLTTAGLLGVLLAPTAAPFLWMAILGMGQGGSFSVGLLLFSVRSPSTVETARLSAMAQSFGYLIAGVGPLLLGVVHDATGTWTPPLLLLLAILVPQFVFGVLAGGRRQVGQPAAAPSTDSVSGSAG
jgi:CP family cyanate transporter-like MFS transporter